MKKFIIILACIVLVNNIAKCQTAPVIKDDIITLDLSELSPFDFINYDGVESLVEDENTYCVVFLTKQCSCDLPKSAYPEVPYSCRKIIKGNHYLFVFHTPFYKGDPSVLNEELKTIQASGYPDAYIKLVPKEWLD